MAALLAPAALMVNAAPAAAASMAAAQRAIPRAIPVPPALKPSLPGTQHSTAQYDTHQFISTMVPDAPT